MGETGVTGMLLNAGLWGVCASGRSGRKLVLVKPDVEGVGKFDC